MTDLLDPGGSSQNHSMIYAGVGSRMTPLFIKSAMTSAAYQMSKDGWMLRSGYAKGADQAFGLGAAQHAEENNIDRWKMYLPWDSYNNAPQGDPRFETLVINSRLNFEAMMAYKANPKYFQMPPWEDLKTATKLLLIRNAAIILGPSAEEPVTCVLAWTPNGSGEGGTGHALRCAKAHDINVFDLALEYDRQAASEFVYDATSEHWEIPW